MILLERDGITVQAITPREEAEYKKLGFKVVETPKPASKKAPEKETEKAGEK